MFVTTAGRTNQKMIAKAQEIGNELKIPYIHRLKKSIIQVIQEEDSDCLVVGKDRLELYQKGSIVPFFFHPNSAMFRIKRLMAGEHDPFINASQLSKGMRFLDCTLGLASDSIVASYIVGNEGCVHGIEGEKYLSYLVGKGLRSWDSGHEAINGAMNRIKVIHSSALVYLKMLPNEEYDCIYFDPMFEERIFESNGIKGLTQFAIQDDLEEELIEEALRVTRQRVILKDHYKSSRFDKYGFHVSRRKSAKFHFGVIQK